MENSTTSGDGMSRAGDILKQDGEGGELRGWEKCDQCGFEYPGITEHCPECYPPSVPSVRDRPPEPEEREPLTDDEVLTIMEASGVNVHSFQGATLGSFEPEPEGNGLELAEAWVDKWRGYRLRWPYRDWMFFYGDGSTYELGAATIGKLGNGKTHLGIAVARELLTHHLLSPTAYRFVTAEALLLEMEGTFRSKSEDSEFRLLSKYEGLDLLHVDDFGVREPSPHAIRVLDELTKRREGKATIWTSNLSLKVIAKQHGSLQRITSRIAGACGEGARYVICFRGEDRRLLRSRRGRMKT